MYRFDRPPLTPKIGYSMLLSLLVFVSSTGASAQEVNPKTLLELMSAEIAGLESFVLEGDAYADARLEAGHLIEHSSQVTLSLRRNPAGIRVTNRSVEATREVVFNDGALSVFTSDGNYYARTEIQGSVETFFEYAVERAGVEVPLLDFISANVADHMLEDADEVRYLEKSLIRDKVYHHIGIRSAEIDVQVWVAAEGPPLPGKLSITSKWEGGAPRFVAFFDWDTAPEFSDDLFDFTPPDDAVEIDFLADVED